MRDLRGVTCVVAVLIVPGACGGVAPSQSAHDQHASSTGIEIAGATAAANSANVTMRSRVTFSGDPTALGFDVSGRVDFADQDGDLIVRSPTSPSTTSTSTDAPGEIRWIGDIMYAKGGTDTRVGHVAPGQWARIDQAKVRAASPCGAVASQPQTFPNPNDTLAKLRSSVSLNNVGTEILRGVSTTHWRAHDNHPGVATSCWTGKTSTRPSAGETIDVWVDAQDRALRFVLSGTVTDPSLGGSSTTITQQLTVEFSDFGVPVAVLAPPQSQVVDVTDATISDQSGPGTVSADGWHDVHGTVAGETWHVWTARSSTGWYCYDATDTPQNLDVPTGVDGYPKHDGHAADCDLTDEIPDNPPFSAYVTMHDATGWSIVGSIGTSGDVHLVLNDGTRVAVAVDPTTELLDWHGSPTGAAPQRIQVGAVGCRVDGSGRIFDGSQQSETATMQALRAATIQCSGVTLNSPTPGGKIPGTPFTLPPDLKP